VAGSIGDIEQALAGEDHDLDDFLRRGVPAPRAPAPAVAESPASELTAPRSAVPARDARASEAAVPAADVERFIVQHVAAALKMRPGAIDPTRSVFDYGVDSVTAVTLCAGLEEWLGIVCDPDIVYAIPVMGRLAEHVASLPRSR
jgi:acyl carrier protein